MRHRAPLKGSGSDIERLQEPEARVQGTGMEGREARRKGGNEGNRGRDRGARRTVRQVVVLLIVLVFAAALLAAVAAAAFVRERRVRHAAEATLAEASASRAELETSRTRAAQAKLDFLRAQISPHFLYNALTAIESYVRSDPERARDLLAGFAEFTRWAFREHTQYATLAEELRFVDIYLELERARFGDRLAVTVKIAPGVLPVTVPSLVLQPLVENAVRHGLGTLNGPARLEISARDTGDEALVTVADHGVGADPRVLEEILAGQRSGQSVGLRNVDERLRGIYGDDHGLVIETEVGAGMSVSMRLPKQFSPAVPSE